MPIPVKLSDVVGELEILPQDAVVFLNCKTGEFVHTTEEDRDLAKLSEDAWADAPAWQREVLPKIKEALESDDYVALPDQFDLDEWSVMERFVRKAVDGRHCEELNDAIHGAGAFRRFKDAVHRLGIEQDWYRFRDATVEEAAVEWLEAEGIPYTREARD